MSSIEKAIEQLGKKVVPKTEARAGKEIPSVQHKPDTEVKVATRTSSSKHQGAVHVRILPILRSRQMLTPEMGNTKLAEEYRAIKRPILGNIKNNYKQASDNLNVIMVTSSLPGEGKTYSTANLAASIATERDRSVLVIDCDAAKHSLSSMFDCDNRPGLLDLLTDDGMDIGNVILSTDIDSLKIIPAGKQNAFSTELLASKQMESLIDEISRRYADRVILLDSPPLLLTSQSVVLTRHAGQIIVVVEEGKTPQSAVIEAISKLPKDKIVGAILNKQSRFIQGGQYGDYYGSSGE